MMEGWQEFFEDDSTKCKSMNRLLAFSAMVILSAGFLSLLVFCGFSTGEDLRQYLNTLGTLTLTLAGLGGFNYAAGRVTGAYTDVRKAQAIRGIPAPDNAPPPQAAATIIQVGAAAATRKKKKEEEL